MKIFNLPLLCSILFLPMLVFSSHAGVYKYQDANGKWHFTDKPPQNQSTTAVTTSSSAGVSKGNLKDQLHGKFNPTTKIDEAMLAVVTVKTNSGSGSGFFVTGDGYIVTNRHVVRPSTSSQSKEFEDVLEQRKEKLADYKSDLEDDKDRLRDMQQTIDEQRDFMESSKASTTQKGRYKRYLKRYKKDKKSYEAHVKTYRKQEKEYKKEKSEFGFSSSLSNFSKKFTVTLKNGKELKARLIRISKNYDLALLKLDNYTTPYLKLSYDMKPNSGTKVFAIGSPLGITDSLTTGIITKADEEHLITDTQILAGNSGGPLIDDKGYVLGVNTATLSAEKYSDTLGLAIYATYIRQEFARELGGKI